MLFLNTIMRATPWNIVNNARRVRVVKEDAYVDRDDQGEHKVYRAKVLSQGPGKKPWNLTIKLYGKRRASGKMVKRSNKAWVHCDCPYFKYYVEVALAARGSSSVMISNGNFPKIRNPRMRPYLCKHLLATGKAATDAKAKKRRVTDVSAREIDEMVMLLEPFLPR